MREPATRPLRRTRMRRSLPGAPVHAALAVALATTLAGCGQATETDSAGGAAEGASSAAPTASPSPSTSPTGEVELFPGCPAGAVQQARPVADVDFDGDGTAAQVGLVGPDATGPCADSLVVTGSGAASGLALDTTLSADTAEVVELAGGGQLLLVRGGEHPRGGYSLHLYAVGVEGLEEVRTGAGEPVLGFVATDGGAAPATAVCTPDGGIASVTTTTAEPPGVVMAWDVHRTSYEINGSTAVEVDQSTRTDQADPLLRDEMPQLFEPEAYFADCIVDPS